MALFCNALAQYAGGPFCDLLGHTAAEGCLVDVLATDALRFAGNTGLRVFRARPGKLHGVGDIIQPSVSVRAFEVGQRQLHDRGNFREGRLRQAVYRLDGGIQGGAFLGCFIGCLLVAHARVYLGSLRVVTKHNGGKPDTLAIGGTSTTKTDER